MKKYEIMYILMPNLDTDAIKAEIESLNKLLTDKGAKDIAVKEMGMRDLAYEIKKQTKGYYVVLNFTSTPAAIAEFNKLVPLDPKVMRFLVTVAE